LTLQKNRAFEYSKHSHIYNLTRSIGEGYATSNVHVFFTADV